MNLYFMLYTDDDGENFDFFVVAKTRAEALALWQDNMWPTPEDKDECGMPDDVDRVFVLPAKVTGKARVLAWHKDLKEVKR